jgi:hypothetical protein
MNDIAFMSGRGFCLAPAKACDGVSCDESGPSIGPVRLLRRTMFGFEPRPQAELDFVFTKTFGAPLDWRSRMPGLLAIAHALDENNLALAMIGTLHLRLPVLNEKQTARAKSAEKLLKAGFNPLEPRDEAGAGHAEVERNLPQRRKSLSSRGSIRFQQGRSQFHPRSRLRSYRAIRSCRDGHLRCRIPIRIGRTVSRNGITP